MLGIYCAKNRSYKNHTASVSLHFDIFLVNQILKKTCTFLKNVIYLPFIYF